MAKDGTNRGGRRIRAGDKPDALVDKIAAGRKAEVLEPPMSDLYGAALDGAAELLGAEMPNPSEYLSARQRDGKPLGVDLIYTETWDWLKARGCEKLVNPRLLEAYAQAFARFIQCEENNDEKNRFYFTYVGRFIHHAGNAGRCKAGACAKHSAFRTASVQESPL